MFAILKIKIKRAITNKEAILSASPTIIASLALIMRFIKTLQIIASVVLELLSFACTYSILSANKFVTLSFMGCSDFNSSYSVRLLSFYKQDYVNYIALL